MSTTDNNFISMSLKCQITKTITKISVNIKEIMKTFNYFQACLCLYVKISRERFLFNHEPERFVEHASPQGLFLFLIQRSLKDLLRRILEVPCCLLKPYQDCPGVPPRLLE